MEINTNNDLNIRKAAAADIERLAAVHFTAYEARFFSQTALGIDGMPYGAPLAVEHPCLALGQDQAYFQRYWRKFAKTMWDGSADENICYVATLGGEVAAFVKGNAGAAAQENFAAIALPPAGNIGELGSIYVDPTHKLEGCGKKLMTAYACDLQGRGYEQMVTSAYYKNDSPRFFEKLGAETIGSCDIPNDYIDYSQPGNPLAVQIIGGTLLYWGRATFAGLCAGAFTPPRPAAPALEGVDDYVC